MRVCLLALLGLLTTGATQAPHAVGWRFELATDAARRYEPAAGDLAGPGPRPVAITIFYPAAPQSEAPATTYRELAGLGAYDRYREPPPTAFLEAQAAALKDSWSDAVARETRSARDVAPARGKYPLVLFAHSTPLGMAAMSEDLAQDGFVVAGVISRGAERGRYRLSVADVQAMGEDLRLALGVVGTLPFVDASRIGVIGMSNGALGAIALANATRVQAIVSLDGTVGERAAARLLPELASAATPASVPPLLHLYAPDNSYLDFSELQKRPGECLTVRVPDVGHSDFLTFALLRPADPSQSPRRDRVTEKFSAITRLTRDFLARQLTSGATGPVQLTESDAGLGLKTAACRAPLIER